MRLRQLKSMRFVVSILLMMVCVQSLSMHFHLGGDVDDEHASHAHSHHGGDVDSDHFTEDHADNAGTDIVGALSKPSFSLSMLVFAIVVLFALSPDRERSWFQVPKKRPRLPRVYYRPPLRAPPL